MNERLRQIIGWFKEHNLADGISASELFEKYNPLTSGGISRRSEITQLSRNLIYLYDMGILGRTLEEKVNGVYRYYLLPEKNKPFITIKQNQVSCSFCGHHYSTRDSYPVWCENCGGCLACCSCCNGGSKEGEPNCLTQEGEALTGKDEWETLALENNGGGELSGINLEELSNHLLATARPIFVEMLKKDRAECELQYKKIIEGLQANLIEKDDHLKSEIEAHKATETENRTMAISIREQKNKIRELEDSIDGALKIRAEQNETIAKLEAKCKKLEEQKTKIVYEDMRNKMGNRFRDLCEEEIKNNKLVMKCG